MYDHITGEVVQKQPARAVLRAGGVGYELKVPMSTSDRLTRGETTQLFTILHVVDGNPTLLGFATREERDFARRLLAVSGVGPAMCLAILSTHAPSGIARAILEGDVADLQRVKGIGKKTAERLCLELRDAVYRLDFEARPSERDPVLLPRSAEDAIAALMTLGYTAKEARSKVSTASTEHAGSSTEELIRRVLGG